MDALFSLKKKKRTEDITKFHYHIFGQYWPILLLNKIRHFG